MKRRDIADAVGVASAAIAAIGSAQAEDNVEGMKADASDGAQTFTNTFLNADTRNLFAAHRSHSSHRSHQSHSSGSGGGGGYRQPQPIYTPPPPPPQKTEPTQPPAYAVPQPPPATTPAKPPTRPPADELKTMIMRVQLALMSRGYDPGAIDGALGPQTTAALKRFQSDNQLDATGRLTTETLTALGIRIGQ